MLNKVGTCAHGTAHICGYNGLPEHTMILIATSFDDFLWNDEILPYLCFVVPSMIAVFACYVFCRKVRTPELSKWFFIGIFVWSYVTIYWLVCFASDLRGMAQFDSRVDDALFAVYRYGKLPMHLSIIVWLVSLPIFWVVGWWLRVGQNDKLD